MRDTINKQALLDWSKTRRIALEEACKNHTGYHKRHLAGQHSSLVDLEWEIQEGKFDAPTYQAAEKENAELRQRIADLKEWLQTKKKQSSELYTDYDNAIVTAFEEVLRKLQGEETKG